MDESKFEFEFDEAWEQLGDTKKQLIAEIVKTICTQRNIIVAVIGNNMGVYEEPTEDDLKNTGVMCLLGKWSLEGTEEVMEMATEQLTASLKQELAKRKITKAIMDQNINTEKNEK